MNLFNYLTFVATETILCVAPGPAVVLIISQSLIGSLYYSARGIAGILTANALYFALSGLGLSAILLASPMAFAILRWVSISYLSYVAISVLRAKSTSAETSAPRSSSGAFYQAVALQLANPKAILFFAALLPQFITPDENVSVQFIVLGITSIAIEAVVLLTYAGAASAARQLMRDDRLMFVQQRVAGVCLLIIALGMLASLVFDYADVFRRIWSG